MKYKGMNENTIRKMFQSNETALLQKGITDMLNTITNTTDSLLSSFSIEKFFSNKNFSDMSAFVKYILKQVEDLGNKASNANVNNVALENSITDYMKLINVNIKKTSESVDKIATKNQSDNQNQKDNDLQSKPKLFSLLSKVISKLSSVYTEEQTKEEEKQRELKQNKLAEEQVSWLQGSLMPWLKKFGGEQRLESDGFIATFFPMLASIINTSPLLLKLIGFGKLFLGIGSAIFGAVKFVEGIGKAVDVLGHEIDFTSLKGWVEALNLGLGNIVSSITGIDLKTVYDWLHNFDRTLSNAYKSYLRPLVKPLLDNLWKTAEAMFKPFIDTIKSYTEDFAKEYPGIIETFKNIYNIFLEDVKPALDGIFKWTESVTTDIGKSIKETFRGVDFNVMVTTVSDTIVDAIENISATLTTMWNFITNFVNKMTSLSWLELSNPLSIMAAIFEGMAEGVEEGIENYEDLKERNVVFKKKGSKGLEQRDLEKQRKQLITERGILKKNIDNVIDNIEIGKNWLGYDDFDVMSEKIGSSILESLKQSGIDEKKSEIISYGLQTSLPHQLKELKTHSLSDSEFLVKAESLVKRQLGVYTDEMIENYTKEIKAKRDMIQSYENMKNGKETMEAVKETAKTNVENTMKASVQAEAEIEKEKSIQPTINANGSGNVITNNNYNNTTSNVQSGLNEHQIMESAKNTAN